MTNSEESRMDLSNDPLPPNSNRALGDLILFVDDEEGIRKMTTLMLEKAGYRVMTAVDGVEAVDVFRLHCDEIDLVILDLMMPRMNGDEAFRELRELRADIPVLLSTGFSKQTLESRVLEDETVGFILKPYKYVDLVSKLRGILE